MGIEVKNITKTFKVISNEQTNILKRIFKPKFNYVYAVNDISFKIEGGEFVGYIGSNGAGKSTTLKMLCGILSPTQGEIKVNGISPCYDRTKNVRQIGVVFGQRSQLLWDLPVIDTLSLYKRMYDIPSETFNKNMKKMDAVLGIGEFLNQPARQLSLGQKMKANIALALIHDPRILFLDEPTIGLDVLTKDNIREALREINQMEGVTIILTTHDLSDIQELCKRIILIDKGKVIYNGNRDSFLDQNSKHVIKVMFLDANDGIKDWHFKEIRREGLMKVYEFDKNDFTELEAIKYIVNNYNILDIKVDYITIESVVKNLFMKGA